MVIKKRPNQRVSIQTPDDPVPVPIVHDVELGGGHNSDSDVEQLRLASPTASYLSSRPSGHHHEDGDDGEGRRMPSIPAPRRISDQTTTAQPSVGHHQHRGGNHHPTAGLGAPQPTARNFGGYHGLNYSMANLATRNNHTKRTSDDLTTTAATTTTPDNTASTQPAVPNYQTYLHAQRLMSTKRYDFESNRYLHHHHRHHHHNRPETHQSQDYVGQGSDDYLLRSAEYRLDPLKGSSDHLEPLPEETSLRPETKNTTNTRPSTTRVSAASTGTTRQRISAVMQAMEGRISHTRTSALPPLLDLDEHGHDHNASIPFYCHPVQRQRWDDDQVLPHINWGDIFFDLFYVAAAYNLGVLLISSMNPEDWKRGIVYFMGIFGPLYNTWENDLYYSSRYTVIDHSHRAWEVIRYVLVAAIILHIKTLNFLADASSFETFALMTSMFLESVMQLLIKLEVAYLGEGDRMAIQKHAMQKIRGIHIPAVLVYGAAAVIAGISYFGRDENLASHRVLATASDATVASVLGTSWVLADAPYLLCLGIYVVQLVGVAIYNVKMANSPKDIREFFVPNNVDYLIHRYGEWIMLMIGESVLSLLIVETVESEDYYVIALVGVLTVIMIQSMKFESEPAHLDGHALWRSMKASIAYSILIQILSMSLIAFGVSYKVMLTLAQSEAAYKEAAEAACSGYDGAKVRDLAAAYDTNVDCSKRFLAALPVITDNAAAALYCGSLTIVLVALELMATTHHDGFRMSWQFLFREEEEEHDQENGGRWTLNIPMLILTIFKLGLILFLATLSQWQSDPRSIASAGFLVVVCMFVARILGWGMIHKEDEIREFLGMSIAESKPSSAASPALDSLYSSNTHEDSSDSKDSHHHDGNDNCEHGIGGVDEQDGDRTTFEKAIWDSSFDAIVVIDTTGTIKHVNETTLDMFGYKNAKELIGRNVSLLVSGGEADNHSSHVLRFGEEAKKASIIGKQRALHSRRKDGSEFPCVVGIKKLPGSTDLIAYFRDSTDLPHAPQSGEEVLSDPILRLVDDGSFDCIVVIDKTGTIQHVNVTTVSEFGYDFKDEIIGNDVSMLVGGGYARKHHGFVERFHRKQKSDTVLGKKRHLKSRRKDGSEFSCLISINHIPGSDCVIGYIRNIEGISTTSQKSIEAGSLVSQSVQNTDEFMDDCFDSIIVADEDGVIIRVNQVTVKTFGFSSKEEMIGKNLSILVGGKAGKSHEKYMTRFKESGKTSSVIGRHRIVLARRHDGSEFPCSIGIKRMRDSTNLIGYIRDMSAFYDNSDHVAKEGARVSGAVSLHLPKASAFPSTASSSGDV